MNQSSFAFATSFLGVQIASKKENVLCQCKWVNSISKINWLNNYLYNFYKSIFNIKIFDVYYVLINNKKTADYINRLDRFVISLLIFFWEKWEHFIKVTHDLSEIFFSFRVRNQFIFDHTMSYKLRNSHHYILTCDCEIPRLTSLRKTVTIRATYFLKIIFKREPIKFLISGKIDLLTTNWTLKFIHISNILVMLMFIIINKLNYMSICYENYDFVFRYTKFLENRKIFYIKYIELLFTTFCCKWKSYQKYS